MTSDLELWQLAEQVGRRLLASRQRLVIAESCTGGWLAKTITDLPGSSQWFECGYVTYSNAAKVRDLQVSERTLELHGAVSEATAREMAAGALRICGADVAVAITGIAGPDGGTPDKPVGTVWFAVAVRRAADALDDLHARVQHFSGDRDSIRRDSVKFALEWLVSIQVLSTSTTV
jgi:nicotinamide-nucleotide amidase